MMQLRSFAVTRAAACLLAGSVLSNLAAQTPISGPLSGTLSAGVYTATNINVASGQTLTLSAGVIIKFVGARQFVIDGTLICNGVAANPVIFTDDADDSAGGDTNNNGPSVGASGSWYNLVFRSGSAASSLNHTEVRYAGTSSYTAIDVQNVDITVTNSLIRDCNGRGFSLNSNSAPTISGCTVQNCGNRAFDNVPIYAVPGLTNNTATGNSLDVLRITTGSVTSNLTLDLPPMVGGAFLLAANLNVPTGVTLTLAPGVVIKWEGARQVVIDGTLLSQGTVGSPVVLTDDLDDSIAGDTTKNGASSGNPGAWYNIVLRNGQIGSVIDHTELRFAGTAGYTAIDIQATSLPITNTLIRDCNGRGFSLNSNSAPTISNCTVQNCGNRAFDNVPIYAVPGFTNNVATGNSLDVLRITTGAVNSNLTLGLVPMTGGAYLMASNVNVASGVTFVIDPGVVIKWEGARQMVVSGTLDCQGTSTSPIIFTDDIDDSVAGDTTKNGASNGAPGAWYNIALTASQTGSMLTHTEVRYSGTSSYSGIDFQGTAATLDHCIIRDGNGRGIQLNSNSFPSITNCRVENQGGRSIDGVRLDAVSGLVNNTCTGNAIDCVTISQAAVGSVVRVGTESMPGGAFMLRNGINVGTAGDLTIEQGVVFKHEAAYQHVFNGRTRMLGTAYEPIVFTDDADDEIAGDSNKDGPSAGSSGAWYNLYAPTTTSPTQRRIEHVNVRFAGTSSYPGVDARGANIQLRAIRVEKCNSQGFDLRDLTIVPVNLVAWDNGGDGIRLSDGAFDVVHATCADNGGYGVRALTPWNATVVNSNVYFNASGNFNGMSGSNVYRCNGGFSGGGGNLDQDPLFVDRSNGDLHLLPTSPCLGGADNAFAQFVAKDFDENSRILDHGLTGAANADMGAFELGNWNMAVVGTPRPGDTIFLTTTGPAGTSFLGFGLNDGTAFVAPYGILLTGQLTTTALVFPFPIAVGTPVPLTVPNDPGLAGTIIGLQTLNFPTGNLLVGNFAQLYRPLVRP
ncbi:MAG: right-handed parallel beta-helix repeat-containing protein [bacterium]|nr:right-handed parallel beta-helix repeat-containing protein [bacterium]